MSAAIGLAGAGSAIVVPVPLEGRSYDILIGRGLLAQAGSRIAALGPRAVAIVTDARVGPLYAERIQGAKDPA